MRLTRTSLANPSAVAEVLQGTPGMTEMAAWSAPNFSWTQLEFALETDMTRALSDTTIGEIT